MTWEIYLDSSVDKVLRGLGRDERERLRDALSRLPRGDVLRMEGSEELRYRLRVGGWRAIFVTDPAERRILVSSLRPRGDAYKKR